MSQLSVDPWRPAATEAGDPDARSVRVPSKGSEPAAEAKALANRIVRELRPGDPFDARAAIDASPELAASGSAVIDLAVEQFCRDADEGRPIDRQEFAARFPTHYSTLMCLLRIDGLLGEQLRDHSIDVHWPAAGERYQGFQLVEEVARGSFSRVFLAKQSSVGDRDVIVKICRGGAREAAILGQLDHEHIGTIYDASFDEQTGLTTICMPFQGTQTLGGVICNEFARRSSSFVSRRALAPGSCESSPNQTLARAGWFPRSAYVRRVVEFGRQVAEALAYTHERQMVHGDIKPENVIIVDETAKLIDFNLSRRHLEELAPAGGTFAYMAPEHLAALANENGRDSCSPPGDVYSLGATLFHAIAGRLPGDPPCPPLVRGGKGGAPLARGEMGGAPHRVDTPRDELSRRRNGVVTASSIKRLLPWSFRWVGPVVARCLEPDPSVRPTAGELADLLGRRPWVTRRRLCLAAVGVVAAGTISAVVPFLNWGTPAEREATEESALAALDRRDYVEAERLLKRLTDDVRDARHVAWLGYCHAMRSQEKALSAAEAQRRCNEAIALFEEAIGRGHEQKDVLWENIGWCRIQNHRRRMQVPFPPPRGFEGWAEQEVFDFLLKQLESKATPPRSTFALLSYAVRRWRANFQMHFLAPQYYATFQTTGREPASDFANHESLILEYCWKCFEFNSTHKASLEHLRQRFPTLSHSIGKRAEFRFLESRPFIPPILQKPR